MASLHGESDIDTSALVKYDKLDSQYGQQFQEDTKELDCIAEDISSKNQLQEHDTEPRSDKQRKVQRRLESSSHFYESFDSQQQSQTQQMNRQSIQQSKQLPRWIWITVKMVLGVDPSKRLLSTIFYMLTLLVALSFTLFGIIFTVFDIASKNTKTTAHIGFISLLIGFSWLSLGIYSFRLAGRLFANRDFAASVRTHSKTLFKISTAALLILCGFGFTGLNLYSGFDMFTSDRCLNIGIYTFICNSLYISRAVFSVIAMMWNLMVGCMLLSVCRTHTIGIRRFARDLEEDGQLYEQYWRNKLRLSKTGEYNNDTASILNNSDWFMLEEKPSMFDFDRTSNGHSPDIENNSNRNGDHPCSSEIQHVREEPDDMARVVAETHTQIQQDVTRASHNDRANLEVVFPGTPPIMTQDELLLCYWKISSRMRLTSMCLQRWLASWMAFVILWCADYVIYWLSHSPNILGIMEFIAPMLLLLLLCAAYAEVNGEGLIMIRCICPTKERYALLSFLHRQPLQMQVYGLSITYSAILTVVLAFSVAFSSRLILDEVVKT